MAVELDKLEKAILTCLEEKSGLGFNNLLRELGSSGLQASRSGLSRRLKRLVRLKLLRKETKPGWPPSTRYFVSDRPSALPKGLLSMGRRSLVPVVLIISLLIMICLCLIQSGTKKHLQSELDIKDELLAEKVKGLENLQSEINAQNQLLDDKEDRLQRMLDLLFLMSQGKAEIQTLNTSNGIDPYSFIILKQTLKDLTEGR